MRSKVIDAGLQAFECPSSIDYMIVLVLDDPVQARNCGLASLIGQRNKEL